jgi:TolB-like protein/DNA-binding winged helix-turn-helix (wHTH) protein/tetratricopeptide (TPR) repeat protein
MDVLSTGDVFMFTGFRLDRRRGGLFRIDESGAAVAVPLGSRALDILDLLVRRSGELVGKQEIMDAVWPHTVVEDNNLTVQISALRRVLDKDRGPTSCIETVPGRGYRFRPETTRGDADEHAPAVDPSDTAPPARAPPAPGALTSDSPRDFDVRSDVASRRRARWHALLLMLAGAALAVGIIVSVQVARSGRGTDAMSGFPHLSLVVLPFQNIGGDAADDYLVEGITDDLTDDLANMRDAFVIARASAETYKGKNVDVRQIGRELGVRYVVEGSVRRIGSTLRINTRLISTASGAEIWTYRFDQDVKDLAAGQGEIVARLRGSLGAKVIDSEVARRTLEHPKNPTAFDLYLRARSLWLTPVSQGRNAEQQALLERALQLQPDFVRAKLELAEVLMDRAAPLGLGLSGDTLDRAQRLVAEAAALQPESNQVLWMRAYLLRIHQRWPEAIEGFQRLVEAYPNDSGGTFMLGLCMALSGHAEEAIPVIERSIRLNPRFPNIWTRYGMLGYALVMLGRDEESIEWTRRALAADSENTPLVRHYQYRRLAVAYARTGRIEEARAALADANRLWPYGTLRSVYPDDVRSDVNVAQTQHYREGLRLAGMRDHAEEDADFGTQSDNVLHAGIGGLTPTTVPGAATIRTADLQAMIAARHPLVIDAGTFWSGRSLPGAVVLWPAGVGGTFADATQESLGRVMQTLTGGNLSAPLVAVGFNSEFFDGRNLALRLVALGYRQVTWYRGGREAWEVNGLPETPTDRRIW